MNMTRMSALALAIAFAASPASALDLSGQSRTYLQSRQSEDSTRYLPFYEYLNVRAEDIGTPVVSFHAGGWFGRDFGNANYDDRKRSSGDLQYAYLSFARSTANSYLNLGRITVNQGVASSRLDGASLGTDLIWGFGFSAFGGVPVETAFDTRSGDTVYGGRVSQGYAGRYQLGASYLLEKNNSLEVRKESGMDIWLRPIDQIEVQGSSLYNGITAAYARHAYYLTLGPFRPLTLHGEFTQISYKDFFTSPTLSVFQLQPGGPLDPNEKLKTAGGDASLTFGPMTLAGDYKRYSYQLAGAAAYYGGRLVYASSQNASAGLSFHRMGGQADALRYNEYRLYGHKHFSKIDVTADLLSVAYVTEINGVKNAYTASLACGYAFTPKARLGADVEYSRNPYFDKDVRGLIQFVYNFDAAFGATGRK